jgi:hypothetical protein
LLAKAPARLHISQYLPFGETDGFKVEDFALAKSFIGASGQFANNPGQ